MITNTHTHTVLVVRTSGSTLTRYCVTPSITADCGLNDSSGAHKQGHRPSVSSYLAQERETGTSDWGRPNPIPETEPGAADSGVTPIQQHAYGVRSVSIIANAHRETHKSKHKDSQMPKYTRFTNAHGSDIWLATDRPMLKKTHLRMEPRQGESQEPSNKCVAMHKQMQCDRQTNKSEFIDVCITIYLWIVLRSFINRIYLWIVLCAFVNLCVGICNYWDWSDPIRAELSGQNDLVDKVMMQRCKEGLLLFLCTLH